MYGCVRRLPAEHPGRPLEASGNGRPRRMITAVGRGDSPTGQNSAYERV